jgi:hypothetical protein
VGRKPQCADNSDEERAVASRADQAKITKIIAASTMNIHMIGAANNYISCFGTCCFRIDRIAPICRESIAAALTIEETSILHISYDQKMGSLSSPELECVVGAA